MDAIVFGLLTQEVAATVAGVSALLSGHVCVTWNGGVGGRGGGGKKFVLSEFLWATPVCLLCFSSACPLFSPIFSLLL